MISLGTMFFWMVERILINLWETDLADRLNFDLPWQVISDVLRTRTVRLSNISQSIKQKKIAIHKHHKGTQLGHLANRSSPSISPAATWEISTCLARWSSFPSPTAIVRSSWSDVLLTTYSPFLCAWLNQTCLLMELIFVSGIQFDSRDCSRNKNSPYPLPAVAVDHRLPHLWRFVGGYRSLQAGLAPGWLHTHLWPEVQLHWMRISPSTSQPPGWQLLALLCVSTV